MTGLIEMRTFFTGTLCSSAMVTLRDLSQTKREHSGVENDGHKTELGVHRIGAETDKQSDQADGQRASNRTQTVGSNLLSTCGWSGRS